MSSNPRKRMEGSLDVNPDREFACVRSPSHLLGTEGLCWDLSPLQGGRKCCWFVAIFFRRFKKR